MRRTYHTDPEKRQQRLESGKQWRLKNAHKVAAATIRRKLFRKFGITPEQYEVMSTKQKGVCALCKKLPHPKRRLAVDHNHETGKVRGLLCDFCNRHLGLIEARFNLIDLTLYLGMGY